VAEAVLGWQAQLTTTDSPASASALEENVEGIKRWERAPWRVWHRPWTVADLVQDRTIEVVVGRVGDYQDARTLR
jgi:hypothetical protein